MAIKNHNGNAVWIKTMTKELKGLEEAPKAEIHIDLLKSTLKKVSNWKMPGHDGIHVFWFKKFTSIHDRLVLEMNRCFGGVRVPGMDGQRKDHIDLKGPKQGTAPNNYRHITIVPMMWRMLSAQERKEIYYFLTNLGLQKEQKRMPQRIQRHSRVTLHRLTHP